MNGLTTSTTAKPCHGRVLRCDAAAKRIYVLEVEITSSDCDLPKPLPGQFYQVKCWEGPDHILRRPISVHSINEWSDGRYVIELAIEDVGWGTHRICSLAHGSGIDLLGPLGNGFEMPAAGRALLVAGGMGIAPLFFLAREMDIAGLEYDLFAGFKSRDCVYNPFPGDFKGGIGICTEDGSLGDRGTAVEKALYLMEEFDYRVVYTCGPEVMMAEICRISEAMDIPCQVSLVSRMACGIGICRGCVRPASDGGNLCVCKEGPVFDSRKVIWQ